MFSCIEWSFEEAYPFLEVGAEFLQTVVVEEGANGFIEEDAEVE